MKVTVIDYGLSNLLSVRHAFAHFGAETLLTSDPADVLAAEKLGVPLGQIVRRHLLPHLLPQFLTGLILQFPHAILHEASVTFRG